MNTNSLAQNQFIIDDYIRNHPKTKPPEVNPMENISSNIDGNNNILEERSVDDNNKSDIDICSLLRENNDLLKKMNLKLQGIEKGMNLILSHIQNIEANMIDPY